MLQELLELNLFAFFLIFARIGTALMLMPGFSATYVNARLRLVLGLTISFVMFPVLAARLPLPPNTISDLALMLSGEVVVGVFFGFILRILISALQTVGTIAALASSLANALIQDPVADQQSSIISGFLLTVGMVLIFVSDLHHLMLRALLETYVIFEPGERLPFGDFAKTLGRQVADSFNLGLQMSAPFVVVGLTYYIGLGLLGRLMPQLPVFFFGLPIQISLQIFVFTITISGIMLAFIQNFEAKVNRFIP